MSKRKPKKKAIGRGGYGKEILRFAFSLYCKGETTSDIAKRLRLRDDCKTISKKTVDRWRTRHNWELLKKELDARVFEQDLPAIMQEMETDRKNITKIKDKLMSELEESAAGSLEGIAYAYSNLLEKYYKLLGMNIDRADPNKSGKTTMNIQNAIIHSGELNLDELSASSKRIDRMIDAGEFEVKSA